MHYIGYIQATSSSQHAKALIVYMSYLTFQIPTYVVARPVRVARVLLKYEEIHMEELIPSQPPTYIARPVRVVKGRVW